MAWRPAAIGLVLVTVVFGVATAESVVATPRVERPAAAGEPRVWPLFSAASGGNEIRNCGWWRGGWEEFIERKALPTVRRHGRVWIHNPGGVINGQAMRFQQFTDCEDQAALTGNKTLAAVADWRAFSRQMSRVAAEGELVIYIGCPATLSLHKGESDDEWLRRALAEAEPIFAIEPKPIVGFDATYGHPADASRGAFGRFGGERGLIARVLREFTDRGYEVLVEHAILAEATWMRDLAGLVTDEWYLETQLRGRDVRLPHYLSHWGDYLKPSEIRGRQVRLLSRVWRKPLEVQRAVVDATLAAGYDVAIGIAEVEALAGAE